MANKKPNKQLVFLITTGAAGTGQTDAACAVKGGLTGRVTQIEYITDSQRTFDDGACFEFTGALTQTPIFKVEGVDDRMTWAIDGPELDGEPVRCVVSKAGNGKVGSFVVTCK